MLDELKKVLGAKEIGRGKEPPGMKVVGGQQALYVSSSSANEGGEELFDRLGEATSNPTQAKFGGCVLAGCSIQAPDGSVFHALEFHGDLSGWHQDLVTAASRLGQLHAEIRESALHISDGRIVSLQECTIVFY